jgi:hypothetical protein
MKAEEARKLSESVLGEESQYQLKNVYNTIEDAASKGNSIAYYYGSISQLKTDGYSIDMENERNESYYLIKW